MYILYELHLKYINFCWVLKKKTIKAEKVDTSLRNNVLDMPILQLEGSYVGKCVRATRQWHLIISEKDRERGGGGKEVAREGMREMHGEEGRTRIVVYTVMVSTSQSLRAVMLVKTPNLPPLPHVIPIDNMPASE